MDKINIFFVISLAIVKIRGDIVSPCPKYFVFEPNKSEDDRWHGIITLQSRDTISGVTLDLEFDKSLIQLGNFFGILTSDAENIKFRIRNTKKVIQPNTPLKIEINAVYDALADPDPPKLLKMLLNGKEICPNDLLDTTCGTSIITTTGVITSGTETVQGQWPWKAVIYKTNAKTRICGGSLISFKHILTAAHCVTYGGITRNPQDLYVILGKYGLYVTGKQEQQFTLTKIVVHPQFNKTSFFNDIAIIHLNQATKYTDFVRPVCLWSQDVSLDSVVGKVGTAVGWGTGEKDNPFTDLLTMAPMPVVNQLDCIYSNKEFYPLYLNKNNFCAGSRNGTSVCNGDSGSGLVFPRPSTSGPNTIWEIRGILSHAFPTAYRTCDPNYFFIFTDIAQYTQWIKENTNTIQPSSSDYDFKRPNTKPNKTSIIYPDSNTSNGDKNSVHDSDEDFFQGDFNVQTPSSVSERRRPKPVGQDTSTSNSVACGTVAYRPRPFLTNGQDTVPGQWPWHAAIYRTKGIQLVYICGASLISDRFVLTAAHCVTRPRSNKMVEAESLLIYFGKYNLKTFESETQDSYVAEIYIHPEFNSSVFYNDISILKLNRAVEINEKVRPCCLWEEDTSLESVVDKQGTVVGWGFDENKKISEKLMQAKMPIVSTIKCIRSNIDFFARFTNDNNFCAGFLNGTSVCNGDSGGSMVFPKEGTSGQNTVWQIRGLVSIGVALQSDGVCGDTSQYVIFTDVAKYSTWIKQIMRS